ncbi:MAG TPA: ATP-binding protein [Methylophilaceae bacterium]|nr:ATP-binding protein [Methylophilaceae bacterium]
MDQLDIAVIHDAKNRLGELVFRLESRGDCAIEIESLIHTSNRLTNLLIWHTRQDGEMRLNVDSASPGDLLQEMQAEFRQFFPKLDIALEIEQAPVFWFYDESYIRLALENALHNACHFAVKQVVLSVREEQDYLIFSVQDDGAGFPADVMANHANNAFSEISRRGTGLGLLLSSHIAKLHKAKGIEGKSVIRNNTGALFELYLP